MKYQLSILASAIILAGCNSSDSNNSTNKTDNIAPTYTVSGTVTAQAASGGETVCADLNEDFICSSDEPSTKLKDGKFAITSTKKSILQTPLVVELDTGSSSVSYATSAQNSANAFFVAPAQQKVTGNEINAVTTLVASEVAGGASLEDAISNVAKQLTAIGLAVDKDSLMSNGADNQFSTLERNLLSVISGLDKSKSNTQLAILSSNLEEYKDTILADAPTDDAINSVLTELNESSAVKTLNDTGIVTYFSDAGDSSDMQTDYPGQDAEYGLDKTDGGFQFTKLNSEGMPVADDATEWSCVKDERSGLIWEKKSDDSSSTQYMERYFVYQVSGKFEPFSKDVEATNCKDSDNVCSTEDYVKYLNKQKVCGITSWRLPTYGEVYNLIDFGETEKSADDDVYGLTKKYFPNQSTNSENAGGELWTSTEFYTEYDNAKTEGSVAMSIIQTLGSYRGVTTILEIYSDKAAEDNYTSWQLPIRLVAEQEAE